MSSPPNPPSTGQAQTSTAQGQTKTRAGWTYLQAVKETFKDKNDNFNQFLAIMKDFKDQKFDTSGVVSRIKEIFKGHPDLILGFNVFLPQGCEITLPPQEEDEPFLQKEPHVKIEEALDFINKIKDRFPGDDHRVYKAFIEIMRMYREENKPILEVYQEVYALLQDHDDLLHDFTRFLPNTSNAVSHMSVNAGKRPASREGSDDRDKNEWDHDGSFGIIRRSVRRDSLMADRFHQGIQDSIEAFCEKVRERLQDRESYNEFMNTFHSYKSQFITTAEFQKLVASLLGNYPDLVKECEDLIPHIEKSTGLGEGDEVAINDKEKSMLKPIRELDLSKCDSCTPSYRLLPEDYRIPSPSARCEIGSEVLNDHWVSVSSGSEDYSFKHLRKNQYEEILFKCEDDRLELSIRPYSHNFNKENLLPSTFLVCGF